MRYDLEWDDFISWEADNPQVEQIRNRIGEHEMLLFQVTKEIANFTPTMWSKRETELRHC
jgi:hypothetical protein